MSQEMGLQIRNVLRSYRETVERMTNRKRDDRVIPILRLLFQLDPSKTRMVDCNARYLHTCTAEIFKLNAAYLWLKKYPKATAAEALTIGALFTMIQSAEESFAATNAITNTTDRDRDITPYVRTMFPIFDREITATLLFGQKFYLPNIQVLEHKGYRVHLSEDGKVFRVFTKVGYIKLEIVS